MKQVVLVISTLGAGGAERVISTLANWWSEHGCKVYLITIGDFSTKPFYELHSEVERHGLGMTGESRDPWSAIRRASWP